MSNKIRFIGNYDVNARGKFLWEILCQLRHLGKGRLLTKNEWARKWPKQPSYLRVVKARPLMDRWLLRGNLWADWTFRGHHLGIYEFSADLGRSVFSDWRLIHKHEEAEFTRCDCPMKPVEFPVSMPLPPYLCAIRKGGDVVSMTKRRTDLSLCMDPQFRMISHLFKQVETAHSKSVYDESNPQAWLDLYGDEMPVKVEAWNVGPATFRHRFENTIGPIQPPELADMTLPETNFEIGEEVDENQERMEEDQQIPVES